MDYQKTEQNLLKAYDLTNKIAKVEKQLQVAENDYIIGQAHSELGRVANQSEWRTLQVLILDRLRNEKQALLREAAELFK